MITSLEPILSEHAFFKGLPAEYLQLIIGCASNVRFDAGETIFETGEEANTFYMIRHGKVSVEIYAPETGPITVETVGEGDVLGWSWLFPPYVWRFNARAMELTRAVALDGKCLRSKCDSDPKLGYELIKRSASVLLQRLESSKLQMLDIYGSKRK